MHLSFQKHSFLQQQDCLIDFIHFCNVNTLLPLLLSFYWKQLLLFPIHFLKLDLHLCYLHEFHHFNWSLLQFSNTNPSLIISKSKKIISSHKSLKFLYFLFFFNLSFLFKKRNILRIVIWVEMLFFLIFIITTLRTFWFFTYDTLCSCF